MELETKFFVPDNSALKPFIFLNPFQISSAEKKNVLKKRVLWPPPIKFLATPLSAVYKAGQPLLKK